MPFNQSVQTLPANSSSLKPASTQFWLLAIFLVIVSLMGGASRVDVQSLVLLRPLTMIFCALAFLTLRREHLGGRKLLLTGFIAVALLCLLHVIPLPPALWQSLPGREILVEVDRLAGLDDMWRPLTMTPMNGWHALASLTIPLTVILLGIQLNRDDLCRLLPVLLAIGAASGLLGMLQVMGDPRGWLYLYSVTNNGTAVGLFANRNHAATLLACLFPMLAVYASLHTGNVDRQRLQQFAAIAMGAVLVPLVLVTGSRSGMLLALLGLGAALLLYRKPVQGGIARRSGAAFKLEAWHLVAVGMVVSLVLLTLFFSRAESIDRLFDRSAAEDTRSGYWQLGIAMVWKYFPFGSGFGSFVEVFQIDEPSRLLKPTYVNHMHNDWLEIVLTGGVPAALLLIGAIATYIVGATRLWRNKELDSRAVKIARLAAVLIVMLAMASITDYPLRTPSLMALFAVLCLWFTAPAVPRNKAE
jgi:O-antigen ligase